MYSVAIGEARAYLESNWFWGGGPRAGVRACASFDFKKDFKKILGPKMRHKYLFYNNNF